MSRYILSEHPQGSPEWRLDRAGKATGSKAGAIVSKIKSGEAAARRDYRVQLVTERLTGQPAEDGYQSPDMLRGIEQEPFARMAYEAATNLIVREAGFAYLPTIPTGCSVDGFVEDDGRLGLVGFKCPKSATHIGYLQAERMPPEYEPQTLHELWITDAEFFDFVSYDSRLPDYLQQFRIRIERAEVAAKIKAYEAEVMLFLSECAGLEAQLRRRAA